MITLINKGIPNLWCNHDFFPYPQKSHVRGGGEKKGGRRERARAQWGTAYNIASHPKVSSLDMSVTFLYLYHMVLFLKFFIDYLRIWHHVPHHSHFLVFPCPLPIPVTFFPQRRRGNHFMWTTYSLEYGQIPSRQPPKGGWVFLCLHLWQMATEESLERIRTS